MTEPSLLAFLPTAMMVQLLAVFEKLNTSKKRNEMLTSFFI
jgi:hypothetical protein